MAPLSAALGQLGQAEVENLDAPVGGDEEILGLEVAVDDPLLVRGRQAARDLARAYSTAFRTGSGPRGAARAASPLRAAPTTTIRRAFVGADVVDGEDVRMIQRAGGARFLLEAAQPVGVGGKRPRAGL